MVEDHIEVIIESLPEEYNIFVTSIMIHIDSYSMVELETFMLA